MSKLLKSEADVLAFIENVNREPRTYVVVTIRFNDGECDTFEFEDVRTDLTAEQLQKLAIDGIRHMYDPEECAEIQGVMLAVNVGWPPDHRVPPNTMH